MFVEFLDAGCGLVFVRELDESKSPRTAGAAVGGQVDIDDLPGFGQDFGEIGLGGVVAEITYKDFG